LSLRKIELLLGRILGYLILFFRFKLSIVKNNLKQSNLFNDKEINTIIKKNYVHYGCLLVEFIHLIINPKHFVKNYVRIHDLYKLANIVNSKKGVFLLSSHIGNWELAAWTAIYNGFKLNVITKSIKNRFIELIWQTNRVKRGMKLIYADTNSGGIKIIKAIKNRELVSYILDQHTYPPHGIKIDFFSRPAWTLKALSRYVQKFSTTVIPTSCYRAKDGFFDLYIEDIIPFQENCDKNKELEINTIAYTKKIESIILKEPSQWIWLHKRWKNI
jgi:Kdo2-lipid IVA lauroyltransferase/acyltransferase